MFNNAIKLYNRNSKQYDIEKVAGRGFLEFLYNNPLGRATLEVLIKRKFYSGLTGWYTNLSISKSMIEKFVKNYNIDMNESSRMISEFKNFNDFFTRKLKENSRNFKKTKNIFMSPGDGRVKIWNNININSIIQIKGLTYPLKELLLDEKKAHKYNEGVCVLLRLAPVDYHRFHFIDNGVCGKWIDVKGDYYTVNPIGLENTIQVFCKNKRHISYFKSENFGEIAYVEVGATSVGSIIQTYNIDSNISRGDEKGFFKFGGSTIIIFIEKNKIIVDEDILKQTQKGFETRVLAGEQLGIKKAE